MKGFLLIVVLMLSLVFNANQLSGFFNWNAIQIVSAALAGGIGFSITAYHQGRRDTAGQISSVEGFFSSWLVMFFCFFSAPTLLGLIK